MEQSSEERAILSFARNAAYRDHVGKCKLVASSSLTSHSSGSAFGNLKARRYLDQFHQHFTQELNAEKKNIIQGLGIIKNDMIKTIKELLESEIIGSEPEPGTVCSSLMMYSITPLTTDAFLIIGPHTKKTPTDSIHMKSLKFPKQSNLPSRHV